MLNNKPIQPNLCFKLITISDISPLSTQVSLWTISTCSFLFPTCIRHLHNHVANVIPLTLCTPSMQLAIVMWFGCKWVFILSLQFWFGFSSMGEKNHPFCHIVKIFFTPKWDKTNSCCLVISTFYFSSFPLS